MIEAAPPPASSAARRTWAWPRLLLHPAWRSTAVAAMLLALGLLLAGWAMPELWRPAWAARRPLAFVLFGCGALLMWLRSRHLAEQRRRDSLSQLTQNSLTPYDFAPVTLPMDVEPLPAGDAAAAPPTMATDDLDEPRQGEPGAAVDPDIRAAPTQWSPAVLNGIEWRRFEALCEELFKQDGYVTRSEAHGSDSGADIRLHSRLDLTQAVRIVQCRPWHATAIGVPPVREFLGAMVDAGLTSGAFMTAGAFAAETEAFARRHSITLVDGPSLLTLIARRPTRQQQHLLAVATQGDYWRPTCRRCGLKMDRSAASHGEHGHWLCSGRPNCQGSLEWTAQQA